MTEETEFFTILMADDDPDDRFIAEQAFLDLGCFGEVRFVEDGEELMHYLRRSGRYADLLPAPRPALILLDLNMPRKDGRQALMEIKGDPHLRDIPVAIWTTSKAPQDMVQCNKAGADAFVTKPADYADLLMSLQDLFTKYCLGWN
jgi:CheY-like chemotaxis protein